MPVQLQLGTVEIDGAEKDGVGVGPSRDREEKPSHDRTDESGDAANGMGTREHRKH